MTDADRARYAAPLRGLGLPPASWWSGGRFAALVAADGCPGPELGRLGALVAAGDVRLDDPDARALPGPEAPRRASDLEIVLRTLAHREGDVRDLHGDFAFCAWNAATHELLAARDAFGVKALFYRSDGDLLAVSSRCTLLADGSAYDASYLAEFLVAGMAHPARTIFADVRALPPGSVLRWRAARAVVERYWSPEAFQPDPALSGGAVVEEFGRLFAQAVRQRLDPGGATWAQLSGGLDSSSVVSTAETLRREGRIAHGIAGTVSYVDSLGDGDERAFSDAVVRYYGVPNEIVADSGMWQEDGQPPPHTDEPQPVYPFYARERRMAAIVRAHGGRVLLSGHGSDHYLAGSLYYLADWLAAGRIGDAARELTRWAVGARTSFWRLAYRHALLPLLPLAARRALARGTRVPAWIDPTLAHRTALADRLPGIGPTRGRVGRKFAGEVEFLLSTLPIGIDRGVLDQELDVRYPFLYRPLVELGLRLPPELRIRPHARKWIQREAMRGVLPECVRTRRGKGGIDGRVLWSFASQSRVIAELLRDPILAQLGCIDPRKFGEAVRRVQRGVVRGYGEISAPLALETWLRVRAGRWTVGEAGAGHPDST